jgi:hypothetical protein
MNTKKKSKSKARIQASRLPIGMQKTREVLKSHLRMKAPDNTFTPMETGQPDEDQVPDSDNPQAVQGGLGPLHEEGEGERQNDQLAELEQIEPEQ